jgi:hypothetical protein
MGCAGSSVKLCYADPPYPGRAHLYRGHPDYAGEVDHETLIVKLQTEYDGWALSTSAAALRDILPLCPPETRTLAWVKHTVTVSWEPLLVVSARKPEGVRDWIQVEPDSYQWREKPDSYVIGQKPEAFCLWMFAWLGAEPGDTLDDLFPGSGNVARAWEKWCESPRLPIGRSAAAEKRAGRRALAKADFPSLLASGDTTA